MNGKLCVGRDELVSEIIASAHRNGAVLLFGGRQAGKTTTLRHLAGTVNRKTANSKELSDIDVAIYVDLMTLKYDATPSDFFRLLFLKAVSQCTEQISGFDLTIDTVSISKEFDLDVFIDTMVLLKACCGEVKARLIFLLDESKRVLGDRFPRGFQDNLFTLLYGESAIACPPISMVFSGGQHLYKFSDDDTSPIGSRAGYQFVRNLTAEAIQSLIKEKFPHSDQQTLLEATKWVMRFTGGQAGLSTKMLLEFADVGGCEAALNLMQIVEEKLAEQCFGVFENWALALTSEARAAWDGLVLNEQTTISTISKILDRAGKDRFLAQRTLDELQYMGMAAKIDEKIFKVNEGFSKFANGFALEQNFIQSSESSPLWKLIENTELALREIINKKYTAQFSTNSDSTMAAILGTDAWDKIIAMKTKSISSYPYSRSTVERSNLSCMYFGNLMSLMISNKAWSLFKHMFRDKRHVEDIMSAIIPVRNDSAHFTSAPLKEMARCQISCDDLLVIVEREVDKMAET